MSGIHRFILMWLCAVFFGCYSHKDYASSAPSSYASAPGMAADSDDDWDESYEEEAIAFGGAKEMPRDIVAASSTEASTPPPRKTARKVYYNGFMRLRVSQPVEISDQMVTQVTELGGYVEHLSQTHLTVRLPVAHFQDTFKALLEMGDVLDKSITAQDVTEAYQAMDLRLDTARATLDRLIELLAQAEDELEKIALLKEIAETREEVDRLETKLSTLGKLAAFSRITIELVPREAFANTQGGNDTAELAWIRDLSPFRQDVAHSGRPLQLTVPDGLVALDLRRHFVTESADGARFWSTRLDNEPEGDTAFWMAAIEQRLAPEFASAERLEIGGFQVLRLVDRTETEPYRYLVGIQARGRTLELIEIYYPSPAHEERYHEAIASSLEGRSS